MEKYTRVRVLGKGTFGNAILTKRRKDNALLVIKEVFLGKMNRKEREEARHECHILQQLNHPNIVRYIEHFEKGNNLYIVMEYCDGGDLHSKIKTGPLKESVILYYLSQICLAMEYLHTRHILHRDIKTMNVFLMKNGSVKLGDFGISTVLRTTMGLANTVCGTPYYFSPEICRNKPYNNKSDVWALGVLLYQLATGRHPFDGHSMQQLMHRIVKSNCPQLPSHFSRDFRQMVEWCLQKDPAKRPSIRQTLGLSVVRRSLEELEENLMLATQCRIRLRDIIDFETDGSKSQSQKRHHQEEHQKQGQQGQVSLPQQFVGVSPGKAAALAVADQQHKQQNRQPYAQAQAQDQLRREAALRPVPLQAVVGPKPSANPVDNNRIENYRRHLLEQYQRRLEHVPACANNANAKEKVVEAFNRRPVPLAADHLHVHDNVSQLKNVQANGNVADAPVQPREAEGFEERMARVNAIMQRYAQHVDPKARETIHAYMRRKQEEYAQVKRKQQERRRQREELRQRELKRVIEHQNRRMPRSIECPRAEKVNNAKKGLVSPLQQQRMACQPSQQVFQLAPQPQQAQPRGAVFGCDPRCVIRHATPQVSKLSPSVPASRPRVLAANSLHLPKDCVVDQLPPGRKSPLVVGSVARNVSPPGVDFEPLGLRGRSAPPRPMNNDGVLRQSRNFHHVDPLSQPGPVRPTHAAGFVQPLDEIPAAVEARRRLLCEQHQKQQQQQLVRLSEVRRPCVSPSSAQSSGGEAFRLQKRRKSADHIILDTRAVLQNGNDVHQKNNEREKAQAPVALPLAPLQHHVSQAVSPFFARGEHSPSPRNASRNPSVIGSRIVVKKSHPSLPARDNNAAAGGGGCGINGDGNINAVQPQIPTVIGVKATPQPRVEPVQELSPVLVHVEYAVSHASPNANNTNDTANVNAKVNAPSTAGSDPIPNANLRLPLLGDVPVALGEQPDIAQQWYHVADKPTSRAPARHTAAAPHSFMQEVLTRPEEQEILAAYQRPSGDLGMRQVIPSTLEVLRVCRESEGEDTRGTAREVMTGMSRRTDAPLTLLKQKQKAKNPLSSLRTASPQVDGLPDLIGNDQAVVSPRVGCSMDNANLKEKNIYIINKNNNNGNSECSSSQLGVSPRGNANAEEVDALINVIDDSAEEGEWGFPNTSAGEFPQEKSLDMYMAMLDHLRNLLHGRRPRIASATKKKSGERGKIVKENNGKECCEGQTLSEEKGDVSARDDSLELCENRSGSIPSTRSLAPRRLTYTRTMHSPEESQVEERQKRDQGEEEPVVSAKRNTRETNDLLKSTVDENEDDAKAENDLPTVEMLSVEEEEEEEEEEEGQVDEEAQEEGDEDFEDAVPLSPVRCAKANDNYRHMLVKAQRLY